MGPARPPNFSQAWESLESNNANETMKLSQMKTIQEAIKTLVDLLGMHPQEGSRSVAPDAAEHELLMAGRLRGQVLALVRAHLFYDKSGAVCMELHVRAETPEVTEQVLHEVV